MGACADAGASGLVDALRDKMSAPKTYDVVDRGKGYYDSGRTQFVHIFAPKGGDDSPVLIFVPDTNWTFDERKPVFDPHLFVNYWVKRGYVVAVLAHRLLPDAGPLEQARDVAKAIGYVQRNISDHDGDGTRVALVGYGSGAHLATLVAVSPGLARDMRAERWAGTIILNSPIMDVVDLMRGQPDERFQAIFGKDPAYWELTSPYHQVTAGGSPFLMVCSALRDMPCDQARLLKTRLDEVKVQSVILRTRKNHADIYAAIGSNPVYGDALGAFLNKIGVTAQ